MSLLVAIETFNILLWTSLSAFRGLALEWKTMFSSFLLPFQVRSQCLYSLVIVDMSSSADRLVPRTLDVALTAEM